MHASLFLSLWALCLFISSMRETDRQTSTHVSLHAPILTSQGHGHVCTTGMPREVLISGPYHVGHVTLPLCPCLAPVVFIVRK